ncbi:YbaY family lipoprotein [Brevundimonas sp.]|uniref:YbaY family lipoprotein n=1 Tax=Brevundimonas sp. TaxID=1871086 RepID=UPI0025C49BD6|nr:YbaY family lipoprotein [Brevundimonas sp.]
MQRAILMTLLPLALAACAPSAAPDPQIGHGMTTVNVTATYRERILLPPGHVFKVRVEDVSLADAPARVLAEHSETLDGRGPPYQATLGLPSSQIDPRHTYAVRAEIRDPSGALRFTTDTRHAVLTNGAPASADIVLVGVR